MKESLEVESLRITGFNQTHASCYTSERGSSFLLLKCVQMTDGIKWFGKAECQVFDSKQGGKKVMPKMG